MVNRINNDIKYNIINILLRTLKFKIIITYKGRYNHELSDMRKN